MNVVDFGILVIIGFYTVQGLQRGFVLGLVDLATFALAILLGARLADIPASPLHDWGIPAPFALTLGVIVAAIVSIAIIGLAVRILLAPLARLGAGTPLGWANSVLGLLPGLARGIAIAAIVMTVLSVFPFESETSHMLQGSRLTRPLITAGQQALDAGLRWSGLDPVSLGFRYDPPVRGVSP
ncbi:MAG: CvpA family protein [Thermomicrobiales bacterium]|nr:CvpA family protein [Thermomicrobiales bacterium]